jgi:hypothetical protein
LFEFDQTWRQSFRPVLARSIASSFGAHNKTALFSTR